MGGKSDYTGTEMYLSLGQSRRPPTIRAAVAELSRSRAVQQPAFGGAPSRGRERRRLPAT